MKRSVFFIAVLVAFALSLGSSTIGFGQTPSQRSDQSIQEWQKDSLRPPQGGMPQPGNFEEPAVARKETKESFTEEAWNTFRDLDRKIHTLGRKAESKGGEIREDAKKAWEDMKIKQDAARKQLDTLSSSAKETWEKTKSETNAALDSLRQAYNKAASYFK